MGKINTLNQDEDDHPHEHGHGSDDDDEGRQGFFVGGSEHSGQQVLGPNERERRARQLFDAVRRAGAEELTREESENIRQGPGPQSSYHGGAYRLGTAEDPVAPPTRQNAPTSARGPAVVRVIVWQNGFSIDDGPLRSFEDQANRGFLMSLQAGTVPPELQALHPGRELDLHLERRATDFIPPKAKVFDSSGHRLGGIVPEVVTIDGEDDVPPPTGQEAEDLKTKAQAELKVDDAKPKGQICIRQPDGQRLIGEFNESHTVEDVRSFIVGALPHFSYQPFQLQLTYPKKTIEDEKQTVVEAEIFKATVNIIKV